MYESTFELLLKFVMALMMGAIIGIERERRAKGVLFAGFRTFMLVCSLGFISALVSSKFSYQFALISFLILGILASLNFYRKVGEKKERGVTTEVAFLITYFIGFILYFEKVPYVFSLALTFTLTLVLVLKESLHEFARKVSAVEIRDFLIFGLVAFVVYPILPDSPIDPYGIVNLKFVWNALVIVLGLSFLVYTLFKIFKHKGVLVNAVLGGLINSIYITNLYSSKLSSKKFVKIAFLAIISSMIFRVFLLSNLINFSNLGYTLFLVPVFVFGYLIVFWFSRNIKEDVGIELKSPLSLKFSISYVLVFSFTYFLANLLFMMFGKSFLYLLLPAGLFGTSILTVTFSNMSLHQELSKLLFYLITFGILGNLSVVFKNNKILAKKVLPYYLMMIAILLLSYFFFVYFK
ncbi:MAG: MgtC/SapB family protein [Candidatus Aenigmarchaeota archaeon]|nr:MgtC/SapB family protein [Candidatus Aenigmarchaeota archaeon]MDW8160235.1 MgtC/SapB family protein [Candidatus Aenigmarchaeota archaeon]